MKPQPASFSSLPSNWQELIRQMQSLNFGRIEGLEICDGDPVPDGSHRCISEYKFTGDNNHRPELYFDDFSLPQELTEFISNLTELCCARIDRITVKHGLPFSMEVQVQV